MESLYNALKHAHSGWRWVVLILLLYAIYNAMSKKNSGNYSEGDRKLNMFTMVAAHLQLTFGLVLYFISPLVAVFWSTMDMKNSMLRHVGLEHLIGMLLALVLITIGHAKSKRLTDANAKHKKIFTMYLIGLIIILASIPWPFRFEFAGWF